MGGFDRWARSSRRRDIFMFLRDIAVVSLDYSSKSPGDPARDVYEQFQRATFAITDLYLRLLTRKVKSGDIAKVAILAKDSREAPASPHCRDLLNVMEVTWPFDFGAYLRLEGSGRARFVLGVIQDALIWTAGRKGWDVVPFQVAYDLALACRVKNEFFWKNGKAWTSPDRKTRARVFCSFGPENVEVSIVMFDKKDRELMRERVVRIPAADAILGQILGDGGWTSDSVFSLTPRHALKATEFKTSWNVSTRKPPTRGEVSDTTA